MNSRTIVKTIAALLAAALTISSKANSIGFDQDTYSSGTTVSVSLVYDFTDFTMFGGGVNIEYDPNALLFTGFTQADLPADVWTAASPIGSLTSPGLYSGVGIGTYKFAFAGINSAATIGTFTFDVLGTTDSTATSCGLTLCILRNNINPFVSLAGLDVTDELISNGISGASVVVPVPAAVWLMLGGLAGLLGFGRKSI